MTHESLDAVLQPDALLQLVLEAAAEVHQALGPGWGEKVYEDCLCRELSLRGIAVQRQVPLPLRFKGLYLDAAYRVDIVIPGQLAVEVRGVDRLVPDGVSLVPQDPHVQQAQLLKLTRWLDVHGGLLVNFNVGEFREGLLHVTNPGLATTLNAIEVGSCDDPRENPA